MSIKDPEAGSVSVKDPEGGSEAVKGPQAGSASASSNSIRGDKLGGQELTAIKNDFNQTRREISRDGSRTRRDIMLAAAGTVAGTVLSSVFSEITASRLNSAGRKSPTGTKN